MPEASESLSEAHVNLAPSLQQSATKPRSSRQTRVTASAKHYPGAKLSPTTRERRSRASKEARRARQPRASAGAKPHQGGTKSTKSTPTTRERGSKAPPRHEEFVKPARSSRQARASTGAEPHQGAKSTPSSREHGSRATKEARSSRQPRASAGAKPHQGAKLSPSLAQVLSRKAPPIHSSGGAFVQKPHPARFQMKNTRIVDRLGGYREAVHLRTLRIRERV